MHPLLLVWDNILEVTPNISANNGLPKQAMMGILINKQPQGHQRWPCSFWLKWIYFTSQKSDPKARPRQRGSNQWWSLWNNPTNRHSLSLQMNTAVPISWGSVLETTTSPKLRSSTCYIPKACPALTPMKTEGGFPAISELNCKGQQTRLHLPLPLVRNVDSGLFYFCYWAGQQFFSLISTFSELPQGI